MAEDPVAAAPSRRQLVVSGALGALLVVAALVAGLGAPPAVAAPLTALAVAAVAWRVTPGAGGRAVLVAVTGVLVALTLLGVALDVLPAGLTRTTWAVGAAVVGLAALALTARQPLRAVPRPRVRPLELACWVLAVGVVCSGFVLAVRGAHREDVAPLQLAVDRQTATTVDLVVSSGTPVSGMVLGAGSGNTGRVLDSDVEITADQPLRVQVPLVAGLPLSVTLTGPDGKLLRQLTVQPGRQTS